jgi:hypothetical protein
LGATKEGISLQLNPTHHQMLVELEAEVDTAEDVYMEDVV